MPSTIGPAAQELRFANSSDLLHYVCQTATPTSYSPICSYPYINAGWDDVVGQGSTLYSKSSSIVFADCSITMASALDEVGYGIEQWLQITMSVLTLVGSVFLMVKLRQVRHNLRESSHRLPNHSSHHSKAPPSPSEIIALLNALSSLSMAIAWVDFWGYADVFPYMLVSALKAIAASCMIAIPMVIITKSVELISTVGLVPRSTAHKLKATNAITIAFAFVTEVSLSILECYLGQVNAGTGGAYDGTVNVVKSVINGVIYAAYTGAAIRYGLKVSAALVRSSNSGVESGGEGYRVMRIYFIGSALGMSLGVLYKMSNVVNFGKTVHAMPPCQADYFDYVGGLLLLSQIMVLFAQMTSYGAMVKARKRREGGGRVYGKVSGSSSRPLLNEESGSNDDNGGTAQEDDEEEELLMRESGEMFGIPPGSEGPSADEEGDAEDGRDRVCTTFRRLIDVTDVFFWFSLCTSLVVGTALNFINQGDVILSGGEVIYWKVCWCYALPFLVASFSCYFGLRNARPRRRG